ncbi:TetR/AcrR family transcriptional regulator [Streptomyces aureocirculatus]|uniref:TetR/AcrR family transcriptional regulator n=1 Tax=Streptomyces aureocirculatus TaxID=67275 RepID=UPI00069012D7|nr:TetR/AcrR family transcriptional regulator [Streptomyces aureocirculatus]
MTGENEDTSTPGAPVGLRQLKKQRTYEAISEAAIALFLERGFEKVSVAEVAAAAEISKPTLFRYFPAKEDLVLHRFADHEDEAARVVTGRPAGRSPLAALRAHFLDGLDRHDPVTGLNDAPGVLAFHQLLYATPSLVARLHTYQERMEHTLAAALDTDSAGAAPDDSPRAAPLLDARLAAAQILAAQRVLARENWRRVDAGERAGDVHADAVRAATRAFDQLSAGLTRYA